MPGQENSVGAHMRTVSCSVAVDDPLGRAVELMYEHGLRQMPVMEHGRPVGMIYDRDLGMAERLLGERWQEHAVAKLMSGIPYCTSPETPIAEVAHHLAIRSLEAAIVMVEARIVGLFAVSDALLLLSRLAAGQGMPCVQPATANVTTPRMGVG